jgi:hypothetical protein
MPELGFSKDVPIKKLKFSQPMDNERSQEDTTMKKKMRIWMISQGLTLVAGLLCTVGMAQPVDPGTKCTCVNGTSSCGIPEKWAVSYSSPGIAEWEPKAPVSCYYEAWSTAGPNFCGSTVYYQENPQGLGCTYTFPEDDPYCAGQVVTDLGNSCPPGP